MSQENVEIIRPRLRAISTATGVDPRASRSRSGTCPTWAGPTSRSTPASRARMQFNAEWAAAWDDWELERRGFPGGRGARGRHPQPAGPFEGHGSSRRHALRSGAGRFRTDRGSGWSCGRSTDEALEAVGLSDTRRNPTGSSPQSRVRPPRRTRACGSRRLQAWAAIPGGKPRLRDAASAAAVCVPVSSSEVQPMRSTAAAGPMAPAAARTPVVTSSSSPQSNLATPAAI